MSVILSVDPGIDVAAAAVFDLSFCEPSPGYTGAARGYRTMETARTRSSELMPARCLALYRWMEDVCERWAPSRVVIEVPRRAGTYDTHLGRQRTKVALNAAALAKLHRSIAAISIGAAAHGVEVVEVPAAYGQALASKTARHAALNRALLAAGQPAMKGNADQRDAAFLGLHYITRQVLR